MSLFLHSPGLIPNTTVNGMALECPNEAQPADAPGAGVEIFGSMA
jgi:hypothetical protein